MAILNISHGGVPAGAAYIGRNPIHGSTLFGNPVRISPGLGRAEVIARYEPHIRERLASDLRFLKAALDLLVVYPERPGDPHVIRDLVCHCTPNDCHGYSLRRETLRALAIRLGCGEGFDAAQRVANLLGDRLAERPGSGENKVVLVPGSPSFRVIVWYAGDTAPELPGFCRALPWARRSEILAAHPKFAGVLSAGIAVPADHPGTKVPKNLPPVPASPQMDLFGQARDPAASLPAPSKPAAVRIAIIGTAGRKEDAPAMGFKGRDDCVAAEVFERMVEISKERIAAIRENDPDTRIILVSGGAAYADHAAVRIFLDGDADELRLYLPARLLPGAGNGPRFDNSYSGGIANHYHDAFRANAGVDGLAEIARALAMPGAEAIVKPGTDFKARNTLVAQDCDEVIAFTFGTRTAVIRPGERGFSDSRAGGVKDGGTADTWTKAKSAFLKSHICLGPLVEELKSRMAIESRAAGPA